MVQKSELNVKPEQAALAVNNELYQGSLKILNGLLVVLYRVYLLSVDLDQYVTHLHLGLPRRRICIDK